MDKKKKIALLIVVGILITVFVIKFMEWGKQKTEWDVPFESDGRITNGGGGAGFEIQKPRDFYITADIIVETGSVTVWYYFDDELVFEETYEVGKHHYESEVYENQTVMITHEYKGSEDSSGHFYDAIHTRETNMSRFLRRLKYLF
ncbi:MAG: hypothetical protein ACI4GD_11280 [Lachnospiraceae bacterium]